MVVDFLFGGKAQEGFHLTGYYFYFSHLFTFDELDSI